MKNFEAQTAKELLKRLNLANSLIKHILNEDKNGDISFNVVEKITIIRISRNLFNLSIESEESEVIEELKKISGTI